MLNRSIRVLPAFRCEAHIEIKGDRSFPRAERRTPFSRFLILRYGVRARTPEIRHEVPRGLRTACHADAVFVTGGVGDSPGIFNKFIPVFRRFFGVEPRILEDVFPPEQCTHQDLIPDRPHMFSGGSSSDCGALSKRNRADRRRKRIQEIINAFELRVVFDIFVKRPEEVLLDIGVRHTEVHVDHIGRRSAGDRQHQPGFRTDILDFNSAERRKLDLRVQLPEFTENFQLNLGVGIRRFRIGKRHDPQRDLQDLALRLRLRFCRCLFFIGGVEVWNGQQGYQYSNSR